MTNNNAIVAQEIVKKLKETKLIPDDENSLENKIAGGTIKENEWKLIFEQQLRNEEKAAEGETK